MDGRSESFGAGEGFLPPLLPFESRTQLRLMNATHEY